MPVIRVTSFPQEKEARTELAAGITDVVHRVTKIPRESIWVIFEPVSHEHWSVGGVLFPSDDRRVGLPAGGVREPSRLGVQARFSLEGRTALVTGGSRGLGEAIAVGLAEAGADVAVAARNRPDLERVASRIERCGRRAAVVVADVTRVEEARRMVEEAETALGPLHILVNNAGINIIRQSVDVTEDEWDRVLDTNLKGVFFCAQAAGRRMVQRRYGRIVNIASQMGLVGFYFRAAYCASKAGVVNLTRVLAVEWASHGVTVNAVAPTFVETPMNRQRFQDPRFRDEVLRRIPAGRLADAQDVVSAVVYLASDAATMVTGHTLLVDGGWVAW